MVLEFGSAREKQSIYGRKYEEKVRLKGGLDLILFEVERLKFNE